MSLRIFLHGLESNNQGTKAVYFREHFPGMLTPNFTGSLRARMESLQRILEGRENIILVGSSFGGLMAAIFALENTARVHRLVLLAPAINLLPLTNCRLKQIATPVYIVHGIQDEVIPLGAVLEIKDQVFSQCTFVEVADDHFLHRTFELIDWQRFL